MTIRSASEPEHRRGGDEQRVADQQRARGGRGEVEPVDAGQQPRLRPQQPGEREHEQHRPAAARPAQLEQRRAEDHQVEGQVEHRAQREQLHVGAGDHHGDREQRDHAPEQPLGEHERDDVEPEQPEQREQHEDPVARGPERRHHPRDQRRERMRRRRAEDVVVRQVPVRQLLAPDERVVGVVVRIGLPDDVHDEHHEHAEAEQRVGQAVVQPPVRDGIADRIRRGTGIGHGHRRRITLPPACSRAAGGSRRPGPAARSRAAGS